MRTAFEERLALRECEIEFEFEFECRSWYLVWVSEPEAGVSGTRPELEGCASVGERGREWG